MKKVFNVLLILLMCFLTSSNVFAYDTTDQDSCEPGRTYYNFYLFRSAETTDIDAHDDVSKPYDFFADTNNNYSIECSGQVGIKNRDGSRLQAVANPSTCTGSVTISPQNNIKLSVSGNTRWTTEEYWTQLENMSAMLSGTIDSYDGWQANENNYVFKVIGDNEIRIMLPGSSKPITGYTWVGLTRIPNTLQSAWSNAQFTPGGISLISSPPNSDPNDYYGDRSSLLPKTTIDLFFGKPNQYGWSPNYTYSGSSGGSLTGSKNGTTFKGNNTEKKFVIQRADVTPGSSTKPCNDSSICGRYSYYSPAIYVVKYTCEGEQKCDENQTCCYSEDNSGGSNSNSNPYSWSSLWSIFYPGGPANNSTQVNVSYNPKTPTAQELPSRYTYTQSGYYDGTEHSGPEGGGILTKCIPSCDPTKECCYKKTDKGVNGLINAVETGGNKLSEILSQSSIAQIVDRFNLIGNVNNAMNSAFENAVNSAFGNINGALLRYEYIQEKPSLQTETVRLSGGGQVSIEVPNSLNRYMAVIPYTDSNGKTQYRKIDLDKADKQLSSADKDKVVMKSCGCDPEIECCYDSTGLSYNSTANALKEAKNSDGTPISDEIREQIETYKLLETVRTEDLFKSLFEETFSNGVNNILNLFQITNVKDGIATVLQTDQIEQLLLSSAEAVPEKDALMKRGRATSFNIEQAWSWPPVVSGMTKHIYSEDMKSILQVKSCGCDEETECCYDKDGNYHYEYSGYNAFRWGAVDNHFHYQRMELSDNPYYNRNTYQRNTIGNIAGLSGASLSGFLQQTSTPVVKCKAYHINLDYACTRDDYQEVSSGKFKEAIPNRIERDSSGQVVRDYDSWYAQLSRGKATGVGYSILPDSMKSLRYRGMDIVCADAYKITYPGIQGSGQKGQFITVSNNNSYFTYNREFNNKTIDTKSPIVKIELKKTCVSTKALSQRTFNPEDILINQINYQVQHTFFKTYLQYSNLFGIDLDHNQTTDINERNQLAKSITEYIKGQNSSNTPIVKARLYYDDYDTAIKDKENKKYLDLDIKAVKCPNLHKQFIEMQANQSGELSVADLGIFCSDEKGNELPNADDSRSSPVYACSDTTTSDLQNETGDSYFERMFSKCAAIPAPEDYESENAFTQMGEGLEEAWFDFLNGFWTVKDYFYKTENIVLYASIPQIIVKGGTAITLMDKYENNALGTDPTKKNSLLDDNSEYVVLPNNSIPIGFDTTSGTKKYRISVDINLAPTRKMPTLDTQKPKKVSSQKWQEWQEKINKITNMDDINGETNQDNSVDDYALQNYNKNKNLADKAAINNPAGPVTFTSDGYIGQDGDKSMICSYKVDDDLGTANFFYRTISLSTINPQGRVLGTNWNPNNTSSSKGAYKGLVQRVDSYKANILAGPRDDGDEPNLFKKADGDYRVLTSKDKFTFKLSAPTMRLIRRYNKLKMMDLSGEDDNTQPNSAVGNDSIRGYADWSLGIVDYNGLSEDEDGGTELRYDNSDGSTKWIVDYKDTSSSASITIPDYVYKRYNSRDNDIGYHWYSPFLWCIYYGGSDYCNSVVSPVQSIKYKEPVKNDIRNVFSGYESVSNQDSDWDLRLNIQKLIKKQNELDNDAYKAVTVKSELTKREDPSVIYISMDHVPTMEEFGLYVFNYAKTFVDILKGADQSAMAEEGSTIMKRLLEQFNIKLNENGNQFVDGMASEIVSQMVSDVLGKLTRYN